MKYCANFNAILTAKTDSNERLITRTRCKMWSCSYCADVNRKIWQAKIITGINLLGGQWSWFTLTAHSKKRGAVASLANLRGAMDRLLKRMKRRFGNFAYVRVYETHADGSYHCHAICNFAFDDLKTRKSRNSDKTVTYSVWLAETAKNLKIGYYTHAGNIDLDENHHAGYVASYITKYIVKLTPAAIAELGRVRHIQKSQNWPKKALAGDDLDWLLKSGYYYEDFYVDITTQTVVRDIQTGHVITSDDFLDDAVYPTDFGVYN